jgi:hypothetical protein
MFVAATFDVKTIAPSLSCTCGCGVLDFAKSSKFNDANITKSIHYSGHFFHCGNFQKYSTQQITFVGFVFVSSPQIGEDGESIPQLKKEIAFLRRSLEETKGELALYKEESY